MNDGKHIDMEKFYVCEASEVRLSPNSHSFFNIDGEIYPNDELYIKLLPGLINMLGSVEELSDEALELKKRAFEI